MSPDIAIVGMACLYPDARSPEDLWENVLAQRRAFRLMPPERLRLADYLSRDPGAPDRTYSGEAALIEGYEFDRVRFRVAGSTFRSADLTHWLALDVAAQALADAGFRDAEGLPRDTTGVLLGNTLTGEFSRAGSLRLRWPYVRRVLEGALADRHWSPAERAAFLAELEPQYKTPFPPVDEETLAGGLSNTIAGRICNHFDLKGGGYTVDGACASSLLAVSTACSALASGDLDVALAGGVDLSLDPFELVGFAKAGALAREEMRVYDLRSAGFWPGEGCGFVVLMRHHDAVTERRRIYAVIRGWGVSSDGSGGMTRPEVKGQLLAIGRAYHRAGFGPETVTYFEGHGTGTAVGDATELEVLSRTLRERAGGGRRAAIGSIKANIGHTKAAAGIAGLIKTTMALSTQVVPPTTGCETPHPLLTGEASVLRVPGKSEPWPSDRPLRAAVSAMGFGGINTHVVIEGGAHNRRAVLSASELRLSSSPQDAELFLLSAHSAGELQVRVERLRGFAASLSRAELTDLAAELGRRLDDAGVRAAVVASNPAELARSLGTLRAWLGEGVSTRLDMHAGVFLRVDVTAARIGFLFPGQGSPAHIAGGAWSRRFDFVRELYKRVDLPASAHETDTLVAQPAIVIASCAGLRALEALGVAACIAVGHSLGELTALHWAGVLEEPALLRIAMARGRAMAELGGPTGAMASIGTGPGDVEALLENGPVGIAAFNSPRQTVVTGEAGAVATVLARAEASGFQTARLSVSHAFHSPLVAAAVPVLQEQLAREQFRPATRAVVSTVTGAPLGPDEDLRALLSRQVTAPVRFAEAAVLANKAVDLLIEVGPGHVLTGLMGDLSETPVASLDAGGSSLRGLLQAVGASFALGAPVTHDALFAGRFARPFDLEWHPRFFANPCEHAPVLESADFSESSLQPAMNELAKAGEITDSSRLSDLAPPKSGPASTLEIVRGLVAGRAELPVSAVSEDSRLLGDLHLNSIVVSQLVVEAARRLGMSPPTALTEWSRATVGELAQSLEELARTDVLPAGDEPDQVPAGVDTWVRAFTVELVERPLPRSTPFAGPGHWRVIAPPDHPLGDPLRHLLSSASGSRGVVVCLPPEPDERHVGLLLQAAHAALQEPGSQRFVLVQHGGGGAAFARTLHLEAPEITTCVVDVPLEHPEAAELVFAEATAAVGYAEAHYDASGHRYEPLLRLIPPDAELAAGSVPGTPLGPSDVLLVTGGGKGIAAECALAVAREMGTRLVLMGRSWPEDDAELASNLARMTAAGVTLLYARADVTDAEAVHAATKEAEGKLGPVTAILHGAGTNEPRLLGSLDEPAFLRTLAPKIQGARNVLAAVDQSRLRLFVAFGSIIARIGMRGEADYALANEWLARLVERWGADHPHCRCLTVEWSVWSGTGMGERLGRVDALRRAGITPISPDEGVAILRDILTRQTPRVSVVVTGRFGNPLTLSVERPELPFLRFLERPRVYYPGIELVADSDVSTDSDPYLDDHVFEGQRLLPAVMGLEAMAQAAMALAEATELPIFEDARFDRPIVVPDGAPVRLRVAALARAPGRVDLAVRSEETSFQVDHFRATCRFAERHQGACQSEQTATDAARDLPVGIDPESDLYGRLLFQRGRFRRLRRYLDLRARECVAEIEAGTDTGWFGRYLPQCLILPDPGARDAVVHAIQACIPHATVLPVGADRLVSHTPEAADVWLMRARERSREGDVFTYDVEVIAADGRPVDQWKGLRLRVIRYTPRTDGWAAALLGPYVERRIAELVPGTAVAVVVDRDPPAERQARSRRAIQQALGETRGVWRRPDGKLEVARAPEWEISTAHTGGLTMVVAGVRPLGCDVESVATRPESMWRELLGQDRFRLAEIVARDAREDPHVAATRVWSAAECLKKAGAQMAAPLTLVACTPDGWVLLSAGPLIIGTLTARVREAEDRLVLGVLVKSDVVACEPTNLGTWVSKSRTSAASAP